MHMAHEFIWDLHRIGYLKLEYHHFLIYNCQLIKVFCNHLMNKCILLPNQQPSEIKVNTKLKPSGEEKVNQAEPGEQKNIEK